MRAVMRNAARPRGHELVKLPLRLAGRHPDCSALLRSRATINDQLDGWTSRASAKKHRRPYDKRGDEPAASRYRLFRDICFDGAGYHRGDVSRHRQGWLD